MKIFKTAKEIIDCLVDYHYRAARLAEEAMDREQEERVEVVFNYLFEHHSDMQEALVDFEADNEGEDDVFSAEVDYGLNAGDAPEAFLSDFEMDENMAFDAVEKLGRALGDYPAEFLGNLLGELSEPNVAEAFGNLLDLERSEQRKLTRAINSLRDM